ncbi:MAG: hypothetical protein RL242_2498 [Pseudomonadota bacterium]
MKKLFLSCLSVALLGGIAMAGGHEKGTAEQWQLLFSVMRTW